jgi:hypothetical protein
VLFHDTDKWLGEGSLQRAVNLEAHLAALTDAQCWKSIRDVWEDAEFPSHNRRLWEFLWASPRPGREAFAMNEAERAALAAMPDQIAIYRGVSHAFGRGRRRHVRGLSWTLDRDRGLWFARRFTFTPEVGWLGTVRIPKAAVRAYLDARNEREVAVVPGDLPRVVVEAVEGRK